MRGNRRVPPGTPLIGVVLLFSGIFRAVIFLGLLTPLTWVAPVVGTQALGLLALAIGTIKRLHWAKPLALLYLVGSSVALLLLLFFSEMRSLAPLDILLNLLLIWYLGAPESEQRTS